VRVLFLAPRHPVPTIWGDQRRALHLLEGLARRAEVTLVAFGGEAPAPEGVRLVAVPRRPRAVLRANLAAPDPRLPGQVRYYLDAGMRSAVARELRDWRPDVVHASLARMAPYLPAAGGAHRHLDLVDALSLNMRERAQAARPAARALWTLEARLMAAHEARAAAAADTCSLASAEDRSRAPGLERAAVIPNGVDLEAFPWADPGERAPVLLFYGNLGYFDSEQAAVLLASEVMPLLRARAPDARLRIVGRRAAPAVRRLADRDGVEVAGEVPAMAPELHGAAVALLPHMAGTGIKNKVLEAFAAGAPVVTNERGVRGVRGAKAGVTHLEGETPAQLADACASLLEDVDRRRALAAAARRLVEERYTWERAVDALLACYDTSRSRPVSTS
jgi:polysaccharide biosynthesis protein PslH